jgi:hypothetical protein
MTVLFTNNAASNLSAPITNTATTITVTTGSGGIFPNPTGGNYFMVTLQGISGSPIEIVKCTARSGDTLTVVRAQEGTTSSAFSSGDQVQLRITAGEMNSIETNLDSLNSSVSTINSEIAALNPVAGGAVYENSNTISSNYTMTSGNNGVSAGPVQIATGITVTIPSSSRWVIV